jgi:peptidoglycan/LPS O-acetylase OafA/YrhL
MARVNRRLYYLDALRGMAALSVVFAHYLFDAPPALPGQSVPQTGLIGAIDSVFDIGKFGVVLFFLISGYIIPNSLGATGDRIGRFCISRFFRLYPLYWFALLLGVLLPLPVTGFPVKTVLANITMLQGYLHQPDVVGAFWTLQIELTFYGTCLVMAFFHRMTSPKYCALACAGFLAFAFALAVGRNLLVIKLPVALPLALTMMYFGTLWRQATYLGDAMARRYASWLIAAITITLVPLTILGYSHDFGFNEHWLTYTTSYLAALCVFLVCTTRVLIEWRPAVWLGEISYSLYLMHPIVAAALFYAGFVAVPMPVAPGWFTIPMIALAIGVSALTYRLIERPFVSLGGRALAHLGRQRAPVSAKLSRETP